MSATAKHTTVLPAFSGVINTTFANPNCCITTELRISETCKQVHLIAGVDGADNFSSQHTTNIVGYEQIEHVE